VLLVADVVSLLGPDINDVDGELGGLGQVLGLAGLGVTTARAGRWSGWHRWAPLGLAVFFVAGLFGRATAGIDPSGVIEVAQPPRGISRWARHVATWPRNNGTTSWTSER
jgi:hypothetical protein